MRKIIPGITADVIAPPVPCTKRAATSRPWLVARPQSNEAAVKTASPTRKIVRRPRRSPRRPASRSRPPKVIR
jgi:hypothetical protein